MTVIPNPRLLLVEDHFETIVAMRKLLEGRGHEVWPVMTLAGALSLIGKYGYANVLLDLILPDGDGLDVLKYIRSRNLKTRVAVITGNSDPSRLAEVQAAGPDLILSKPFLWETLVEFLDHADTLAGSAP